MSALEVLYVGGTGQISAACVRRSLERGHRVTVLNRGQSALRPLPDGVETITADVHDPAAVRDALGDREFDSVSQFVAFTPEHVAQDIETFAGRCGQYVFISSASAYQKPPLRMPVTESTPLKNPFWQYSRDKIACEELLATAWREQDFPVVTVRPSHTYDETQVVSFGGWTDVVRMREGRPVVVHGDGTTQWTVTHVADFAVPYATLLERVDLMGEAVTITGDEAPTWDAIYRALARAAGVPDPELVHVASEDLAVQLPDAAPGLLGDRSHSMVFDNTKAKSIEPTFATTIPFAEGARRIVEWHDAHPEHAETDAQKDEAFDRLVAARR